MGRDAVAPLTAGAHDKIVSLPHGEESFISPLEHGSARSKAGGAGLERQEPASQQTVLGSIVRASRVN